MSDLNATTKKSLRDRDSRKGTLTIRGSPLWNTFKDYVRDYTRILELQGLHEV